MFNGKIHYTWSCSIAMLVYQRVYVYEYDIWYIYIYTHTHLHIISGQWYRQVWKWGIAQTSIFKVKLTIDSWLLRSSRHILVWSPKVWFRFFFFFFHWEWKIREKSLVGGLEPWNFITFIQLGIIIPTDKLIFFRTSLILNGSSQLTCDTPATHGSHS